MADADSGAKRSALFRLEFGGASGWGHLVRSGALASDLRRRGWSCVLWTASDAPSVPREMSAPFDRVIPFHGSGDAVPQGFAALVIDHYDMSDAQLRAWRGSFRGTLLVLDDEAVRRLDAADLVLNARVGLTTSPYAPGVRALLGESFALLRPGLREPAAPPQPFRAEALPVLVMTGGTDPAGMTATALGALADVDAVRLVPIVVRPGVKEPAGVDASALRRFAGTVWLGGVNASELAGWAAVCRFAVSAAGGTLYELASLRLPFVSVVVAGNQQAVAAGIAARWGMPSVEAGANLRSDLADAVRRLLLRVEAGDRMLTAGFSTVDGRGAERVADALEG